MIETLTLITIAILLLIYFRPGKTPKLDNPLVINRTGRYQATLAPQLNLAQPFIESIAEQFGAEHITQPDDSTQFFEVYDNQVTARGQKYYLLTISQRAGMLYFHATYPGSPTPLPEVVEKSDPQILTWARNAAQQRGISVKHIPNAS